MDRRLFIKVGTAAALSLLVGRGSDKKHWGGYEEAGYGEDVPGDYIYVNSEHTRFPWTPDGSFENPFRSLREAIANTDGGQFLISHLHNEPNVLVS